MPARTAARTAVDVDAIAAERLAEQRILAPFRAGLIRIRMPGLEAGQPERWLTYSELIAESPEMANRFTLGVMNENVTRYQALMSSPVP